MILTDEAVEILQRALDHITLNPNEWDQRTWGRRSECGTACCVAGRILLNNPTDQVQPHWESRYGGSELYAMISGRRAASVSGAERILGLGGEEIEWYDLTHAENTIENVWFYGQELAQGRLRVPVGVDPKPRPDYEDWDDSFEDDWINEEDL